MVPDVEGLAGRLPQGGSCSTTAMLVKHRLQSRACCLVFSSVASRRRRTRHRENHVAVLAPDVRIAQQSSAMSRM